jgi:hypothetical protein
MPVHDWTRVDAGIFHAFHQLWIAELHRAMTRLLPPEYYSLPEQVTGTGNPDVIALKFGFPTPPPPHVNGTNGSPPPDGSGGVAVAAPPKTRFQDQTEDTGFVRSTKSIVVRHTSGDAVVAVVEIVSPGNKGGKDELESFVRKAVQFLKSGVSLVLLDLFPPGPRDPNGLHPLIWASFKETDFALPADKRLTQVAYAAGRVKRAYIEPVAVGDALPELPLFLTPELYVPVPLSATYEAAWGDMPRRWQDVLTAPG